MARSNEELELLIENEKEWRRELIAGVDHCREKIAEIEKTQSSLKTWNRVFQLLSGGALGSMWLYIQSKLGGKL